MSVEQFEHELRTNKHRDPFRPFVVELIDGRSILVDEPALAFDGGRAVFLGSSDIEIFDCEEVQRFRPAQMGPAA